MANAKKLMKKPVKESDSFAGLKKLLLEKYRSIGPGKDLGKEFEKVKKIKK